MGVQVRPSVLQSALGNVLYHTKSFAHARRPLGEPVTIPTHEDQQQAKETLAYIRRTMESASTYTAVSGWGLLAVGGVGLLAAWLSWSGGSPADLRVWIPAAVVSVIAALAANAAKAHRLKVPVWSGAVRKIMWVMTPALAAGALLTFALADHGVPHLIPGTWLALYGTGVSAGGTFSVRAIRAMGIAFLVLGAAALLRPDLGLLLLGLGFGGVHLGIGLDIIWRHGG